MASQSRVCSIIKAITINKMGYKGTVKPTIN